MVGHRHRPGQGRPPDGTPTGLTASQVAHDSITLSWTAPTEGTVTGYRIFRGTDAGSLAAIVDDTGNIDVEETDSTVRAPRPPTTMRSGP